MLIALRKRLARLERAAGEQKLRGSGLWAEKRQGLEERAQRGMGDLKFQKLSDATLPDLRRVAMKGRSWWQAIRSDGISKTWHASKA